MKNRSKPATTIGTKELIDFPTADTFGVPAKVDTGADSSAIWASNIREKNGTLSFTLFDKQSPFYTGSEIATTHFSVVSIKNSFGDTEFRYKVPLQTVIAGRKLTVRFTLANRANNRFPVLIGRRTLHGKFIVDVSRGEPHRTFQILLLTTKYTPVIAAMAENLMRVNDRIEVTLATYEDLDYYIGEPANRIILRETGKDIANFDFVYFKATARYMDVAAATAQYIKKRGIPFVDRAITQYPASSKLYQYVLLTDNDVAVPNSLFMLRSQLEGAYGKFVEYLGSPFVLKDIHASKGALNFLIRNEGDYHAACEEIERESGQVIGQQFIDNDGDYRVLVFGAKIPLVIHRVRTSDATHLNNTSSGARATLVPPADLPTKVQFISIMGAKVMDREIAGVDMVQDLRTKKWYCFEVNDGPQLASGTFTEEKHVALAEYFVTELTR